MGQTRDSERCLGLSQYRDRLRLPEGRRIAVSRPICWLGGAVVPVGRFSFTKVQENTDGDI